MEQKLWTIIELAEYLGVPVNTVYSWNKKGTAPRRFQVGKYVRYRQDDIESWLENGGSKPRLA